jgi:RNA polymerase sigma factor (sigma-70 family)
LQPEPNVGSGSESFEAAAAEAYPALIRAATVLCWWKADIEDVVQETLLSAYKSYGSFRRDSLFLTWSYTILARCAHTANRKRGKLPPSDYIMKQPEPLPPADRAVVLDEDVRAVVDAIRELPERQREIITLYLLEELSYAEIGAAMGVAIGTVKATIFEAKVSLRKALAKKGFGKSSIHVLS